MNTYIKYCLYSKIKIKDLINYLGIIIIIFYIPVQFIYKTFTFIYFYIFNEKVSDISYSVTWKS